MATKQMAAPRTPAGPDGVAKLLKQYGCGPVQFSGTAEALFDRHLLFDKVIKPNPTHNARIAVMIPPALRFTFMRTSWSG